MQFYHVMLHYRGMGSGPVSAHHKSVFYQNKNVGSHEQRHSLGTRFSDTKDLDEIRMALLLMGWKMQVG